MRQQVTAYAFLPIFEPTGKQTMPSHCAYAHEHGHEFAQNVLNNHGWRPYAHTPGRYRCRFDGRTWVEVFSEDDSGP